MLRWLRNTPENYPNAGKFGALLGMGASIAPIAYFRITSPEMTRLELVTALSLMVLGALFGFLLGSRRPVLGLVVVPLCIGALSFASWILFVHFRDARTTALRHHLSEYTSLAIQPDDPGDEKGIIIRRKVVAIDREKNEIDSLQYLLPDDLRADRPEEVRTVLWLEAGKREVGVYPRGGKAYQRYTDVKVIDLNQPPKLLIRKRIYGGNPPERGSSSNLYGSPPYQEIIDFLRSTPDG
jgi:hypothetical protein